MPVPSYDYNIALFACMEAACVEGHTYMPTGKHTKASCNLWTAAAPKASQLMLNAS